MDNQKEVKAIANEICNYVKSKDITSVAVVAKSPYLEHLHNTGIAEWLVKKSYGDTKAAGKEAVKEFVERLREKEISVKIGNEWKAVVTNEDIDELVKEICGNEI